MLRNKKRLTRGIAIIIIFISIFGFMTLNDVYENREAYREKLIRFHVIANSDSSEDQALKLKVRDKILDGIGEKLGNSSSIEETKSIIEQNLTEIEYIAKEEINKNEKYYDVNVSLGEYAFPTKSYGNFTLPAGDYEAVRVVIGEGKGQNWWCVMFPPLCYIDITHGLTDDKTKNELKNVLTEDEYNMVISAKKEDEVPIKLKFKVVELFESTKLRLAELIEKLEIGEERQEARK